MNKRFLSIFTRYLMQFLLLVLVFTTALQFTYRKIEASLEQNAYASNMAILSQAALLSDGYLDSMHSTISQLMLDPNIEQMIYLSPSSGKPTNYYLLEARNSLRSIGMTNRFISSIYIYYANLNLVLTESTVYHDPRMFHSIHLAGNDEPYEAWLEDIGSYHAQDFYANRVSYINGVHESVILYEQSIPLTSSVNYNRGTLCILINEKNIRQMMNNLNVRDGWYYILNEQSGQIIATSEALSEAQMNLDPQDSVYDGKRMLTARITSQNGWTFVAALSYDVVMENVYRIYQSIMLIYLLCVMLSICFSLYAAYRNSTPVVHLLSKLNGSGSEKAKERYTNHFALIENAVNQISDRNRYLSQQHTENIPLLRAYFFERLLNEQFEREHEQFNLMRQLGIPINASVYSCVFVSYDSDNDDHQDVASHEEDILNLVTQISERFVSDLRIFPYLTNRGSCMLLICLDECRSEGQLRNLIDDFCETILQQSQRGLFFACGSCVKSPALLHQTVAHAHQVLISTAYRHAYSGIRWYDEIPLSDDIYLYSQENAAHLASLLRSGNNESCHEYLHDLLDENMTKRSLSPKMLKHLLQEISGTIINAALPMGEPGQKIALRLVESFPSGERHETAQYIGLMDECIVEICRNLSLVHDERKKKLVDKLRLYIQENYPNSNLSLCSIAETFNLSQSYLSTFFRENTGVNISRYIENTRIDAACAMLQDARLNIDQISAACGYNSALSFRRAFKRLKDVNPSEMKGNQNSKA